MEIEAGKVYKHPEIEMPFIGVTKKKIMGRDYWLLVAVDIRNYEINENGEAHKVCRVA